MKQIKQKHQPSPLSYKTLVKAIENCEDETQTEIAEEIEKII